ncbi:hypothetical protein D4R99_04820 [bacterium]|nr:MAG: hypothetical protein D4R99_04820 [bacterium]
MVPLKQKNLWYYSCMEKQFEQDLLRVNELVKCGLSETEFMGQIDMTLDKYQTMLGIFWSQKEKHEIMNEIHEKFRAIERGEGISGFTEGVQHSVGNWDTKKREGVVFIDGRYFPITEGDLIADGIWGNVDYVLGPDIPRLVKKKFLFEEAKRRIMEILNTQYSKMASETKNISDFLIDKNPLPYEEQKRQLKKFLNNPFFKSKFYTKQSDFVHWGSAGEGFVAERLIESFFEKHIIDSNLKIEMVEVDRFEDYESKVDFMLRVPNYMRGIHSDSRDSVNIGVQLTIGMNSKKKKIEESENKRLKSTFDFDDVVVVRIPIKDCVHTYYEWKNSGMPPGGPTQFLSMKQRELIFRGVLKDMISKKEIDQMWSKILEKGEIGSGTMVF